MSSSPGLNADATDTPAAYAASAPAVIGVSILFTILILSLLMFYVYVKWLIRRSPGSHTTSGDAALSAQHRTGLDEAAIAQLPTFVYTATSPVNNSKAGKLAESSVGMPAPECAVCLSEFQDNEKGRSLPACKHIFHTECIDMWFSSHSTCPLCRTHVGSTVATLAETTSTHQQPEAAEPSQGTAEGHSQTSCTVEYPCDVLFWGDQTQVALSQEPATPVLPSLRIDAGARELPHITIGIPPIEDDVLVSASGCLSAKHTTEQEAGSSQPLKSPSFRTSIKRMLSRQSSRHRNPSEEGNEDSPR